jgi:hypothetical protein
MKALLFLTWLVIVICSLPFAGCFSAKFSTLPQDTSVHKSDSTVVTKTITDSAALRRADSLSRVVDSLKAIPSVDPETVFNDYPFQDTTKDVQDKYYWKDKAYELQGQLRAANLQNLNLIKAYDDLRKQFKPSSQTTITKTIHDWVNSNTPLAVAITALVLLLIAKIQAALKDYNRNGHP